MTLTDLVKVMTPPATPVENGKGEDWSRVEEAIGTQLPSDYKEYITTFGTGKIADFILPFNPFSKNEFLNLLQQVKEILDALRELKSKFGDEACPYPLYPEPEGLLPWGTSDNGNNLFWLTRNIPVDWPVLVKASRGPKFEQYDESMTSFLAKLIAGDIVSEIIPQDVLDKASFFVPLE